MRGKSSAAPDSLLRVFGVTFGLAAVVGNVIGQGILRTPGIVAGAAGAPAYILLLWLLGGLYTLLAAVAFVELATAIPSAGGTFTFVARAFGERWGTLAGWNAWSQSISSLAVLSVVVGEFLHRLGVAGGIPGAVLAPMVILLFWLLNLSGTRLCGRMQTLLSASKLFALVAIIVLLFASRGAPTAKATDVGGFLAIVVGLRVIVSTYAGAASAVYFAEEMPAPERTLPRATFGGIAAIMVLYLLLNGAMLHVLSPAAMAASKLPAADALGVAVGSRGEIALTVFGILSVCAVIHLGLMFTARLVFAMARTGVLPRMLRKVSVSGTPRVSLTITAISAAALASSGTYLALLAMNVALGIAATMAGNLSVIRLRRIEPDLPRPWRMPFYPWPVVVALLVQGSLLVVLVYEDPMHSLFGALLIIAIAAAYAGRDRLNGRKTRASPSNAEGSPAIASGHGDS